MKVCMFGHDIGEGRVWITVEGKKENERFTVQCLTSQGERHSRIKMDDCGIYESQCSEVNEKAFEYWGQNRCMTALFKHAEINGIELI